MFLVLYNKNKKKATGEVKTNTTITNKKEIVKYIGIGYKFLYKF